MFLAIVDWRGTDTLHTVQISTLKKFHIMLIDLNQCQNGLGVKETKRMGGNIIIAELHQLRDDFLS